MKDKDWRGQDKWKHMGVCLVLAVLCPPLAVCAAVWKEWHDRRTPGNHWCWWDVMADACGIVVGTAMHVGIVMAIV